MVLSAMRGIGLMQGRWIDREKMLEPWTLGLADMLSASALKTDVMKKAIAHTKGGRLCRVFEDYDILLTPVLAPAAFDGEQGSFKSFDALYDNVLDYVPYTPQYNVAGNPAISLPLYTSAKGLPIGSQFAARFGGEETLLHLAYELESATWADRWRDFRARYRA